MYDVFCDVLSPHNLIYVILTLFPITGILDDLICRIFAGNMNCNIYFSFSLFILIDTPHYAVFAFHYHVGSSCI